MGEQLLTALQQAVVGLLFRSESDAPFSVFTWSGCPDPLTPEEVLARMSRPTGTPVTQQSLADFFRNLTVDKDWYGEEERAAAAHYRDLQALLQACLPDAQVFRVGKGTVAVLIVGHSDGGRCVGLKTESVET